LHWLFDSRQIQLQRDSEFFAIVVGFGSKMKQPIIQKCCALVFAVLSLLAGSLRPAVADGSVIFLPIAQHDAQPLVTYVGPITGTNMFIGLAVENDIVTAYVCDSATVSIWFKGMQAGDGAVLTAANGASVLVSIAGDEATGTLTLPDGTTHVFAAQAGSQAGLFRLDRELDEGPYLLGGWIVLPNGEQRGALSANNTLIANPTLNTSTLQLSVPLSTVLSTTTLPTTTLSTLTSTVTLQPVIVRPGILQTSRPNRPFEFVMVTLGDSYASGEGNPEQKGEYDRFGNRTGLVRFWDILDESQEIQACHRSGQSGAEKAATQLRKDFPGITLTFQSFACSGAEIRHLINETYRGVDAEFRFPANGGVPPQITALRNWLRSVRNNSQLDALYMNIGGNDARFGDVIAVCMNPLKGDDCWARTVNDDSPTTLAQAVQAGIASLPAGYDALNDALHMSYFSQTGTLTLAFPQQIYITQIPNVTQKDDGSTCNGNSLDALEWLRNVHPSEVSLARDNLIIPVNSVIASAAARHRWNVISGVVDGFSRHGYCATDRYVNLNRDAVMTQGADYPEQPPWLLIGSDKISAGIMHPNDKGFEEYAKHIRAAIAPQIRARFTPAGPVNLRMGAVQPGGFIELQWDDRSNNEARFEFDYADIGLGLPNGRVNSVAGDRVNFVLNTTRNEAFEVRVRACGPIPDSCSAYTPFLRVSNFPPDAPTNFRITAPEFFTGRPASVTVGWNDVAFNELSYTVEHDVFTTSTTRRVLTLPANRAGATLIDFPSRIRVRACNKAGCSAWSSVLLP
jgi:hypothetical protein